MPTYIDYHEKLPALPPEAARQMVATVKSGKRDDFGVKPLNVFVGNGEGWCLTDAPDQAAVVDSHRARGFKLRKSDVRQVQPLV